MSKRERLITTAGRLFYERGFHATGVADILAAAGVAKGTLYQHFASKESLMEEVVRRKGEEMRARFMEWVERQGGTPKERLLSVFDAQDALFWGQEGYCGCPFTRVAGEFSDREHPLHRVASLNKRLITSYLSDLSRQAGAAKPDVLAEQLTLLLEGAAVMHSLAGAVDVTQHAREAGRLLVEAAL